MELYEYADPALFAGKKILYLHGFASSGQSGTVRRLRLLLPEAEVVAPDIPVDLTEALPMLRALCAAEHPDLILGTSMGGMLAEQLSGYDRICVNPALQLHETLLKNNGLGRQVFHNPRQDGQTEFLLTKALLEGYRAVAEGCFSGPVAEEQLRVWGLFGLRDQLVDSYAAFAAHYQQALRFDGEHQLSDHSLLHSVLPLLRRIDDRQSGKMRKVIVIQKEGVLDSPHADIYEGRRVLEEISRSYLLYFWTSSPHNEPATYAEDVAYLDSRLGVLVWNRVLQVPDPALLLGDYLIKNRTQEVGDFLGTVLEFGGPDFHGWAEIRDYFSRLGGQ